MTGRKRGLILTCGNSGRGEGVGHFPKAQSSSSLFRATVLDSNHYEERNDLCVALGWVWKWYGYIEEGVLILLLLLLLIIIIIGLHVFVLSIGGLLSNKSSHLSLSHPLLLLPLLQCRQEGLRSVVERETAKLA